MDNVDLQHLLLIYLPSNDPVFVLSGMSFINNGSVISIIVNLANKDWTILLIFCQFSRIAHIESIEQSPALSQHSVIANPSIAEITSATEISSAGRANR